MTKPTDKFVVMDRLKMLRKEAGLTQKQVADEIHFSVSTIKQYETGRRIPEDHNLRILASFYNVYPGYIRGETDCKDEEEELFRRWNECFDVKKSRIEVKFLDLAEALGYLTPSENTEEELQSYIEYNRLYEERKKHIMKKEEIKIVLNSAENRIIENFETGEITIHAKSEADLDKAYQHLVNRGVIENG